MCGIFCSISRHAHIYPPDSLKRVLEARGPDASRTCVVTSTQAYLTFHSTVLSLRGQSVTSQPFQRDSNPCILCWNGEAWTIQGDRCFSDDTYRIYDLLHDSAQPGSSGAIIERVVQSLSQVAGPYAFVFHNPSTGHVFFGRDFLGRRSLLYNVNELGDLIIASASNEGEAQEWSEVEADGIYCVELHKTAHDRRWGSFAVTKSSYAFTDDGLGRIDSVIPRLVLNRQIFAPTTILKAASSSVTQLQDLLSDSISLRCTNIPDPPRPISADFSKTGARIACLFSGGLDCTILARLLHERLPMDAPVDLINVAFENPRIHKTADDRAYESCPDRITGRASYHELCHVCPDRIWRFVAVNVPFSETQMHRTKVISLIYPHNTEMDLSIALALYFAARGIGLGITQRQNHPEPYTTSARVLLSGLGADELFAGYTRHATAYKRAGFDGLLDELSLDVARLGNRNLGRDDRVISHWGKEARYPYLDEYLVRWALQTSVCDKTGFGVSDQQLVDLNEDQSALLDPEKKVLRCLAWKLGMTSVANEKKRAIQFGARTAKMERGGTKGTQVLS